LLGERLVARGKQGFSLPMHLWLRNELRDVLESSFQPEMMGRVPWLDDSVARKLFDAHMSGAADHGRALWTIHMLVAWYARLSEHHAGRPAAQAS
jgi:asparagine synthase (glutamine-hydrolysing)